MQTWNWDTANVYSDAGAVLDAASRKRCVTLEAFRVVAKGPETSFKNVFFRHQAACSSSTLHLLFKLSISATKASKS